jgi:hypothetical protein
VLERVDGLAGALVADWAQCAPPEGRVSVQTQKTTLNAKYIDLELAFGSASFPDLRVWVEIKHGADLGPDQLENYEADIAAELQARSLLFLLAPRRAMPLLKNSTATPVDWETVARFVGAFRQKTELPPAQRWLLDEFSLYLKEEALNEEEALTSAHAFALSARLASERAVARVIEFAMATIDTEWGTPQNVKKAGAAPSYGVGWWASYESPQPHWGSTLFEWALTGDEIRPEPRHALAFFAGVTFPSAKETRAQNPEWFATLAADGFERVWWNQWRIWRPLYPEHLLASDAIHEQGGRLGDWVVETFQRLAASPPPP